jgi:hypothetical protein
MAEEAKAQKELTKDAIATRFVRYCKDVDVQEAQHAAMQTGGSDIMAFIGRIRDVQDAAPALPMLLYDEGSLHFWQYDIDVLSKREQLVCWTRTQSRDV